MRHVPLLLSCLLLSDLFLLSTSATIIIYMPLRSSFPLRTMGRGVMRSMRFLVRMTMLMRRLNFTRRMLRVISLLMLMRGNNRNRDDVATHREMSCLQRLLCEMSYSSPSSWIFANGLKKMDTERAGVDEGITLTFSLSESQQGRCESVHRSCPFSGFEILQTARKLNFLGS